MRILPVVLVFALILAGCIGQAPEGTVNSTNASNLSNVSTGTAITREICDAAHGNWNECGSACRGAPEGTACIMMCVQYCECGGIAGFACPTGYACTDYLPKGAADAMGICKKVSE